MSITGWAILLPGEDRTTALTAVMIPLADIRWFILALVDVTRVAVALVIVARVAVAVVAVARVAVVVALVVIARVVIAIATTEYPDTIIGAFTFSNQGVQGLLLINQLVLLVQQMLLLVEKLLNHFSLLTSWPLSNRPSLIMLELHMPVITWERLELSRRIAIKTLKFRLCHCYSPPTLHVVTTCF